MSKASDLNQAPEQLKARTVWSEPLPRWEQLPPPYRRELVMLLAALLVKRLRPQELTEEMRSDE